jgi:hypothetical protein
MTESIDAAEAEEVALEVHAPLPAHAGEHCPAHRLACAIEPCSAGKVASICALEDSIRHIRVTEPTGG